MFDDPLKVVKEVADNVTEVLGANECSFKVRKSILGEVAKLNKLVELSNSMLAEIMEDKREEGEESICGDCKGNNIIDIITALPGTRAVFAGDKDPAETDVRHVVAFAVRERNDGGKYMSGITLFGDTTIMCDETETFIGYLGPGQDTSDLDKDMEKLSDDEDGDEDHHDHHDSGSLN